MNVRMSTDLRDRAQVCAAEIGVPLYEWMRRACEINNRLRLEWVVPPQNMLFTTRADSVPVTCEQVDGMPAIRIRRCVAAAVLYCERMRARRGPVPKLPPGNYVIQETT